MPTVKELREEAKAKNLRGYSTMNKGQLEELLRKEASEATERKRQQEYFIDMTSAPSSFILTQSVY